MRHKSGKDARRWQEQIKRAAEHAPGVRDYCEKNGIQRQAFYYWKKRLKGGDALRRMPMRRGPKSSAFAKVEIVAPSVEGRLPDPKWLAEFLLALGAGVSP